MVLPVLLKNSLFLHHYQSCGFHQATKIFTDEEVMTILAQKFTGEKAKLLDINKKALETGRKAILK